MHFLARGDGVQIGGGLRLFGVGGTNRDVGAVLVITVLDAIAVVAHRCVREAGPAGDLSQRESVGEESC